MVTRQSLQEIVGDNRVMDNYNPIPEAPKKARMFKVQNNVPKRNLVKAIIGGAVILVSVAGAYLGTEDYIKSVSNMPAEPSEQVEQNKFFEDYNGALNEYSAEAHKSGLDKELLTVKVNKGEVPVMFNGRYAAFSLESANARYLDKKESVSNSDLINFVKAYSERQK